MSDISRLRGVSSVEALKSFEPEGGEFSDTLLILDNVVGFKSLEGCEQEKLNQLLSGGALLALTCQSVHEDEQRHQLFELFGRRVEYRRFDPVAVYGAGASRQFGLGRQPCGANQADVYYVSEAVDHDAVAENHASSDLDSVGLPSVEINGHHGPARPIGH